ncbi:MAG: polysaccharide biosynthesis/export family protein [Opitutaceae bacterium]|nr:polysaccharide biosynthesis/export family protein [Opitutaceae bacterium]
MQTPQSILHSLLRAGLWLLLVMGTAGSSNLSAQRLPATTGTVPLTYTIALTDRLRIGVYQEDDLSIIARVDSLGCVNLPLAGEVKVMGLTIGEAQKAVEEAYIKGRYLRNPQVTINVEEYAPREVSIHGQVRTPGRYSLPIEATMTVLDLVTKAGGLTDTAKGSEITVTRVSADGKRSTYTIDVESLIKGRDNADVKKNALPLLPGDIVNVPERII